MSIISSGSLSNITSNLYSSTTSSIKVTIPEKLSTYLSDTQGDSKNLTSTIKKIYTQANEVENERLNSSSISSTSATKLTTLVEKFVKCYNNIVSDNSSYNDEGLKSLAKKMNKIVNGSSSTLSDLGITINNDGELAVNGTTLSTASTNGDLSEFINNNKGISGLFYQINKIASNLNKDDRYYLSDISKQIINKANNLSSTNSNQSTSSTFDTYV